MTVELRKLSVLEWIAKVNDEQIINELYESISTKYIVKENFNLSKSRKYSDIKKSKFDLEQIKSDQDYHGVDEIKMDNLIAQLDIEQSIEELLNDLN